MDALDSRSLSYIDCFAQKFSTPGQVRYRITTGAGAHLALEGTIFTIKISRGAKGQAAGKQHDVTVRREGRGFSADPPHLEIEVGDIVLWHAPDAATPSFMVRGEGTNMKFDSSALTAEAIYTHAFGMSGYYEWVDANNGAVSGIVEVRSLDTTKRMDGEKWLKALKKGALITINGQKATPDRIQILTGQTVVWAVKKAPGISITDARLVQKDKPPR